MTRPAYWPTKAQKERADAEPPVDLLCDCGRWVPIPTPSEKIVCSCGTTYETAEAADMNRGDGLGA